MKIAGIQIRRRFFVSVGLLIAITGIWVYWSRFNQPKIDTKPTGQTDPFVRIAGAGEESRDKVLEERAEFFDPTPLFLPTSRNFQQGSLPDRLMAPPGQVFHDFEPKFNFAESSLPDYGIVSEAGGNSLPEVLARGNDAPFSGFGRIDRAIQPLAKRSGYIEVKALKSGILSLSEALTEIDLPQVDYTPAEFIVAVAAAGLIGEPVMTSSSGRDEIDGKLKEYLVNVYRIGERLAPGRYTILVGP